MLVRARHYQTSNEVDLRIEDGAIASIEMPSPATPDLQAGWVAPAFFDLQINGSDGHSFNSSALTLEQIQGVVDRCRRHGIADLCPTLITQSYESLEHGFKTLAKACEQSPSLSRALPAFHLEGPYISPEDGPRGAHPREHVRKPDWDEFQRLQDAAGGRIRLLTLAPEHDGAIRFIERVVGAGVVVALAHTAADGQRIRDAVRAGARLSTHLGNGSHAVLPRHENYIWEQLANDDLWASIIADGFHLPETVVRCIIRVKTPQRTILTCDASSVAGLPPGRYKQWDTELEILANNKVVVPGTPYLAGSGAFTDLCVGNAVRFAGVTLTDAVDMAVARPRELLGLPPRILEPTAAADLVLFAWEPGQELRVLATVVAGEGFRGANGC